MKGAKHSDAIYINYTEIQEINGGGEAVTGKKHKGGTSWELIPWAYSLVKIQ